MSNTLICLKCTQISKYILSICLVLLSTTNNNKNTNNVELHILKIITLYYITHLIPGNVLVNNLDNLDKQSRFRF